MDSYGLMNVGKGYRARKQEIRAEEDADLKRKQDAEDREYEIEKRGMEMRSLNRQEDFEEFDAKRKDAMRRFIATDGNDYEGLSQVYSEHFGIPLTIQKIGDDKFHVSAAGRSFEADKLDIANFVHSMGDPDAYMQAKQSAAAKAAELQARLDANLALEDRRLAGRKELAGLNHDLALKRIYANKAGRGGGGRGMNLKGAKVGADGYLYVPGPKGMERVMGADGQPFKPQSSDGAGNMSAFTERLGQLDTMLKNGDITPEDYQKRKLGLISGGYDDGGVTSSDRATIARVAEGIMKRADNDGKIISRKKAFEQARTLLMLGGGSGMSFDDDEDGAETSDDDILDELDPADLGLPGGVDDWEQVM